MQYWAYPRAPHRTYGRWGSSALDKLLTQTQKALSVGSHLMIQPNKCSSAYHLRPPVWHALMSKASFSGHVRQEAPRHDCGKQMGTYGVRGAGAGGIHAQVFEILICNQKMRCSNLGAAAQSKEGTGCYWSDNACATSAHHIFITDTVVS